jgi:hypothetical protein
MLLSKIGYWLFKLCKAQEVEAIIYEDIEDDELYYQDQELESLYLYNL